MSRLLSRAGIVLSLSLALAGTANAQSVLIADANYGSNADLAAALSAQFTTVDRFDLSGGTLTLQQLSAYNSVIVYTNTTPANPAGNGDVLADYVDAGGCLVLSTYGMSTGWAITGRIQTPGYAPLQIATNGDVSGNLNAVIPGDPIFNGVDVGALTYFHNSNFAHPTLDAGATLIADDGNGINMIARNANQNVVGINLFPGSGFGSGDDLYTMYTNAASDCSGTVAPSTTATFQVTKTFTDLRTDEIDVNLTCNGGLPLAQDFTIAGGGPGVTFTVQHIPTSGVTCEVTESGGPDNYTPELNGGDGCTWTGVTSGYHSCAISNVPDDGTFTVNMTWIISDENAAMGDYPTPVTIWCDAPIVPGVDDPASDNYYYDTVLSDGEFVTVEVDTSAGDASCWAIQDIVHTGVEPSGNCSPQDVSAAEDVTCTFENTLFFEGIPSLNQYGLAILVLLTLGIGFVSVRRFT